MPDVRPQTRPPQPPPHVPLARRLAIADRHREPVAQPVAAQPRANILPAIVSGGFGFVVGAMFWHMIGFWGFVERVLRGGAASRCGHDGPAILDHRRTPPQRAASIT